MRQSFTYNLNSPIKNNVCIQLRQYQVYCVYIDVISKLIILETFDFFRNGAMQYHISQV